MLILGCGAAESDFDSEQLIRVGRHVVTVLEFNRAFELVETAYALDLHANPAGLLEARLRLLNQMTAEALMLARADELGMSVSERELEDKVDDIKADYPDGTFEDVLLEAAVPFDVWKQRLKIRLLMEKLIAAELRDQMSVSTKEIGAYYEKHFQADAGPGGADARTAPDGVDPAAIIRDLKREKAEAAYLGWIEGLKARYPVEINRAVWEKLSAPGEPSNDGDS